MKRIVLGCLIVGGCLAEAPTSVPVIPAELREQIAWDVADVIAAQSQLELASKKRDADVARANEVCGKDFFFNRKEGGGGYCQAKPKPAPPVPIP